MKTKKYVLVEVTESFWIIKAKGKKNKTYWPPFKGWYFTYLPYPEMPDSRRKLWCEFGDRYATKKAALLVIKLRGLKNCRPVKRICPTIGPYETRYNKDFKNNPNHAVRHYYDPSKVVEIKIIEGPYTKNKEKKEVKKKRIQARLFD